MIIENNSTDIWDYLLDEDMPYMPSRKDRDILLSNVFDKKRVRIWDYFFRIKEKDVGKSIQQRKIKKLQENLSQRISTYNNKVASLKFSLSTLDTSIRGQILRTRLFGFSFLFLGFGSFMYLLFKNFAIYLLLASVLMVIVGLIFLVGVRFTAVSERNEYRETQKKIYTMKIELSQYIKDATKRIRFFEEELYFLREQIPPPPSPNKIQEWLIEDFKKLREDVIDITSLGTRLIHIKKPQGNILNLENYNPITVTGPGELQPPQNIPPKFSQDKDLNKHLTTKRVYHDRETQKYDIYYAVYYIEFILVADDMLVTVGLFYDFITQKIYAKKITEQFYKDVASISIMQEFRELTLETASDEITFIEDAPTFTMALTSGEKRKITFVSDNYFAAIQGNLNINDANVSKSIWMSDAQEITNNTIKALRNNLRKHKQVQTAVWN